MGSRFALTLTRVGPATAVGSTQSVAPKLRAAVNFFGFVSIAMMRAAPLSRAAWDKGKYST